MNVGTLYSEKRTLVEMVLALTEQSQNQDHALIKILKMVITHAQDSQNPLDRVLRDRVIDEVLKLDKINEPDSGTT